MAETVRETVSYCLFRDGEPTSPHVVGEGVTNSFGFHPGRLEEKRPVVIEMIEKLDSAFRKSGGGGASFLQLCVDKDGNQWGEHRECSDLIAIANALKLASFPMGRNLWSALPGGMPYVTFE
jgi:hypothetical protein